MIKIGITPCFDYPSSLRPEKVKTALNCDVELFHYFAREGVMPILIPNLDSIKLKKFMGELDGFVFQGGGDISPELYGETPIDEKRWPVDRSRDDFELQIIDYAVKSSRPILGICRGAQLLNVYFGGTLYQDLPSQNGTDVVHRDPPKYDKNFHEIVFKEGGLLGEIYGEGSNSKFVNSLHHQAVKTLGCKLKVEAISPVDNIIEAFSYHDLKEKFILAVQWHPEWSNSLKDQVISPEPLVDQLLHSICIH